MNCVEPPRPRVYSCYMMVASSRAQEVGGREYTWHYPCMNTSSLVSVLCREAFSHPYIYFFRFLVNGVSVTSNNNNYHNHLLQSGFLGVY